MKSPVKILVFGIIGTTLIVIWILPYLITNDVSLECFGERGECFTGKVTRIIDGDTIRVNDIPIRFALASAPELEEDGGIEAKEFIEKSCPVGSIVTVDEDDGQLEGSFDRMIATVNCGDILLNSSLLENNLGKIDTKFCSKSEFGKDDWAKKFGC